MNNIFEQIAVIGTAILVVAIIAVLVGQNAKTADVLSAAGSSFATIINAATKPVTG